MDSGGFNLDFDSTERYRVGMPQSWDPTSDCHFFSEIAIWLEGHKSPDGRGFACGWSGAEVARRW